MLKAVSASETRIVFLINLVQDVAVVHPLVRLCARELGAPLILLVSDGFRARDTEGRWARELALLAAETGASFVDHSIAYRADAILEKGGGVLIAASESDLPAHRETHLAVRQAFSGYLKITLQHGFECVGFLHNHGHDLAHGTDVRFAADVLAGWMPRDRLTSLHRAERDKLVMTGPTASIDPRPAERASNEEGLIAENLQSPRLLLPEAFDARFAATFTHFRALEAASGRNVTLRPHPTGLGLCRSYPQATTSVDIDEAPTYAGTLGRFGWAITPPSSIVFDLIRAGVPVAVWHGESTAFDTRHYQGLTQVGNAADWTAFGQASAGYGRIASLARQTAFVEHLGIPQNMAVVGANFLRLISAGLAGSSIAPPRLRAVSRFVVVTDVPSTTLEMQLVGALRPLVAAGALAVDICPVSLAPDEGIADVAAALASTAVDALVFCAYAGEKRVEISACARARAIPAIDFPREGRDTAAALGIAIAARPKVSDATVIGCLGDQLDPACVAGLATVLAEHPDARVDLIGMDMPVALEPFGARVTALPTVRPQRALLETIGARGWTIGIAADGSLTDWLTLVAAGLAPLSGEGEASARGGGAVATAADPESWAAALRALLTDEHGRLAAAGAAQDFAEQHFALDTVIKAFDHVLRDHGLRLHDARRAVQSLSRAA